MSELVSRSMSEIREALRIAHAHATGQTYEQGQPGVPIPVYMHIPVQDTDCDVVLADALDELERRRGEGRALREALEAALPRLCDGCWNMWPLLPDHYIAVEYGAATVMAAGESDTHQHPRGGMTICTAAGARRALALVDADREGETSA